jgi:aryl-alcohol dehydrogenase-like predicted oxidoreductase
MRMRFLGKTGIQVSELCLGTLTFGGEQTFGGLNQREADILVNMALQSGINFIDTADVYSYGESEQILGKALGPRRKDIILATKVRAIVGQGPNDGRLTRHHIIEGCNASLNRLKTDYIDLYQVHSFDPNTPLEETLRALDDLVSQGKVRYIGCSNFAGWQLMKALSISDAHGWVRFATLQAYYSLLCRDLEYELVPLCQDQGLGILVWSPTSGGFLTGKYLRGKPRPTGARLSDPKSMFMNFDQDKGYDIIEELDNIAKAHDSTVAQAALNYLLLKPGVTSVIIGARSAEQLADNLKTMEWQMTNKEFDRIDGISNPPRVYPYWFLAESPHDHPAPKS